MGSCSATGRRSRLKSGKVLVQIQPGAPIFLCVHLTLLSPARALCRFGRHPGMIQAPSRWKSGRYGRDGPSLAVRLRILPPDGPGTRAFGESPECSLVQRILAAVRSVISRGRECDRDTGVVCKGLPAPQTLPHQALNGMVYMAALCLEMGLKQNKRKCAPVRREHGRTGGGGAADKKGDISA